MSEQSADGPVLVTVEYRVPDAQAREFVVAMEEMRSFRPTLAAAVNGSQVRTGRQAQLMMPGATPYPSTGSAFTTTRTSPTPSFAITLDQEASS